MKVKSRLTSIIFACVLTSITQNIFCGHTCSKQHPLLEAKAGYFFFTSPDIRHVYDQGGLDVQLCGSYPSLFKFLHIYGSVEYLQKSGRSIHGHQRTSIWEIPLSLGLRPVFPLGNHVEYYFTIGPRYFFVRAHNQFSLLFQKKCKKMGVVDSQIQDFCFIIGNHFTIDLFGEYSYRKLHFHSKKAGTQGHTVQVGGVMGGGLGWSF